MMGTDQALSRFPPSPEQASVRTSLDLCPSSEPGRVDIRRTVSAG